MSLFLLLAILAVVFFVLGIVHVVSLIVGLAVAVACLLLALFVGGAGARWIR